MGAFEKAKEEIELMQKRVYYKESPEQVKARYSKLVDSMEEYSRQMTDVLSSDMPDFLNYIARYGNQVEEIGNYVLGKNQSRKWYKRFDAFRFSVTPYSDSSIAEYYTDGEYVYDKTQASDMMSSSSHLWSLKGVKTEYFIETVILNMRLSDGNDVKDGYPIVLAIELLKKAELPGQDLLALAKEAQSFMSVSPEERIKNWMKQNMLKYCDTGRAGEGEDTTASSIGTEDIDVGPGASEDFDSN